MKTLHKQTIAYQEGHANRYSASSRKETMPKFKLIHDGQVVGIFGDEETALKAGQERFGQGSFYVAEIGRQSVTLGELVQAFRDRWNENIRP